MFLMRESHVHTNLSTSIDGIGFCVLLLLLLGVGCWLLGVGWVVVGGYYAWRMEDGGSGG
jgi:hypothetical protein